MANFQFTRNSDFPPVLKNLIIINVLVYVAQIMFDGELHITERFTLQPIVSEHLKEGLRMIGAADSIPHFNPYQLLTHMFTHAPFPTLGHIVFNMLNLWIFGRVLENYWGSKRFLQFYLLCGLGAAALHLAVQYFRAEQLANAIFANDLPGVNKNLGALAGAIGASGAIMGVWTAFAYLFPNTELMLIFLPIPVKAKWMVLVFVAIDLFGGLSNSRDNVAHFAHLGGALTGFLIVYIWNKTNRRTFY